MSPRLRARTLLVSCFLCTAVAAPRAHAVYLPFSGTLRFDFAVERAAVPIELSGYGVAVARGPGAGDPLVSLTLPGSIFSAPQLFLPVTDVIGGFPIAAFWLVGHDEPGTAFGSGLPLVGFARFCLFGTCGSPPANIEIPLSLVGGGTSFMTGAMNQTVIGAPWTTATAAVGTITRMGFAHGAGSGTVSTATTSGTIQLVTPIFVSTSPPVDPVFASFVTLTLNFVPEPSTLLLASSAIALLLGIGARRARR
jgi:hypothetical protein